MNKTNKELILELRQLVGRKDKMSTERYIGELNSLKFKINKSLVKEIDVKTSENDIMISVDSIISAKPRTTN